MARGLDIYKWCLFFWNNICSQLHVLFIKKSCDLNTLKPVSCVSCPSWSSFKKNPNNKNNTPPLYGVLLQAQSCLLAHSGSMGWLCEELSVPAGLYLKVTVMNGISLLHAIKRWVSGWDRQCSQAHLCPLVLQHHSFKALLLDLPSVQVVTKGTSMWGFVLFFHL